MCLGSLPFPTSLFPAGMNGRDETREACLFERTHACLHRYPCQCFLVSRWGWSLRETTGTYSWNMQLFVSNCEFAVDHKKIETKRKGKQNIRRSPLVSQRRIRGLWRGSDVPLSMCFCKVACSLEQASRGWEIRERERRRAAQHTHLNTQTQQ
jgi:hypothetical protein